MKVIDAHLDPWHTADAQGAAPLRLRPHLLLTPAQWQAGKAAWARPSSPEGRSSLPIGVMLGNDDPLPDIVPDLDRLALLALPFPTWTDGRAYSLARLLRVRHRFGGELRAVGQVLVDMLPLLARTGFDSVVLAPGQDPVAAPRVLSGFSGHYQADAWQPVPWFAREAA